MGIYLAYKQGAGSGGGELTGDVTEQKHTGWVELLDAQWSMSRTIRNAVGMGANRESTSAYVSEFTFSKYVDSASSKLANFAFNGQAKPVTIHFTRVDQGEEMVFRQIALTNAITSSLVNSGHSKDRPIETITLNFTQIEITDYPESSQGASSGQQVVTYDLTTAKAS